MEFQQPHAHVVIRRLFAIADSHQGIFQAIIQKLDPAAKKSLHASCRLTRQCLTPTVEHLVVKADQRTDVPPLHVAFPSVKSFDLILTDGEGPEPELTIKTCKQLLQGFTASNVEFLGSLASAVLHVPDLLGAWPLDDFLLVATSLQALDLNVHHCFTLYGNIGVNAGVITQKAIIPVMYQLEACASSQTLLNLSELPQAIYLSPELPLSDDLIQQITTFVVKGNPSFRIERPSATLLNAALSGIVRHVKQLSSLRCLQMCYTDSPAVQALLPHLTIFTNLTKLHWSADYSWLPNTSTDILDVIPQLSALVALELFVNNLVGVHFDQASKCLTVPDSWCGMSKLEEVVIRAFCCDGRPAVWSLDCGAFVHLAALKALRISSLRLTPPLLVTLSALQHLTALELDTDYLDEQLVWDLDRLPITLQSLDLLASLTNEAEGIGRLSALTELRLCSYHGMPDVPLSRLTVMTSLRRLTLYRVSIGRQLHCALQVLPLLAYLFLDPIVDGRLPKVLRAPLILPSVEEFHWMVDIDKVEHAAWLLDIHAPRLISLGSDVNNDSTPWQVPWKVLLSLLAHCPLVDLDDLFTQVTVHLDDEGLLTLARDNLDLLVAHPWSVGEVTDVGLVQASCVAATRLTALALVSAVKITSVGLTGLARSCPRLEELTLGDWSGKICSQGWQDIVSLLPGLRSLTLIQLDKGLDDHFLLQLAASCPQLEVLDIYVVDTTEVGLMALVALTQLRTLNMKGLSAVTPEIVSFMFAVLKRLVVMHLLTRQACSGFEEVTQRLKHQGREFKLLG